MKKLHVIVAILFEHTTEKYHFSWGTLVVADGSSSHILLDNVYFAALPADKSSACDP
jgi:hypothetical protein